MPSPLHKPLKRAIFFTILLAATLAANAQRRGRGYTLVEKTAENPVADSIAAVGAAYAQRLDSLAATSPTTRRSLDNPYYYPLFAGSTLLSQPIHTTIGSLDSPTLLPAFGLSQSKLRESISWALIEAYATHPELVRFNMADPTLSSGPGALTAPTADVTDTLPPPSSDTGKVREQASWAAKAPIEIHQAQHNDEEVLDLSDFHIFIRRPNFWTFKGSFSTQFMQYHVTDNWYKGGENNLSLLAAFTLEANYDNKARLTFSNKIETKLGFQTYQAYKNGGGENLSNFDRRFRTNSDLLRLTNKLGIKAHSNWYYSVMLQTWTQFYHQYKNEQIKSDILSPIESVLSLGMDYKLAKKRVNFNVNIAPAALDFKFCKDRTIIKDHINDPEHPDRRFKFDLGSTLTANITLKFCEQVNWQSRFYFFYNYKTVNKSRDQIKWEWENTINLKVNKFLSAKIFLYPRYEGGLKKSTREETGAKIQFNEFLSVGFDINF